MIDDVHMNASRCDSVHTITRSSATMYDDDDDDDDMVSNGVGTGVTKSTMISETALQLFAA